jgi:hypothetical protein
MRTLWSCALAGALTLTHTAAAHAQRWGGPEIDRVYSPGARVPFDGAPWTYQYNYTYSALYLGSSGRSLNYADYLDRFDRALKFGYPIPRDPTLAHRPPRIGPDGNVIIDPADPETDPADLIPSPPPRRGLFRR